MALQGRVRDGDFYVVLLWRKLRCYGALFWRSGVSYDAQGAGLGERYNPASYGDIYASLAMSTLSMATMPIRVFMFGCEYLRQEIAG